MFASHGHKHMCVIAADLGTEDASKACSKERDVATVSVCLTGNCPAREFGAIPSIKAGGLETLGWICEAVRRRGVLFIDSQGNCVTP